jgi:hypothetical protein
LFLRKTDSKLRVKKFVDFLELNVLDSDMINVVDVRLFDIRHPKVRYKLISVLFRIFKCINTGTVKSQKNKTYSS